MKKNKLFTLALLSSVFAMPSCDDIVDCGCDCNQPNITGWEMLDANKEKNADGTVAAGSAIIIYGSNLSDITAITFRDKAAELQPAYMSDNQIVFKVPEGIAQDCGAHIVTKGCPTGFDTDILKVVVSAPCVSMCDNEFAVSTLKVKGNSLFAPLEARFMDATGAYTLVASTENGMIKIDDQNNATVTIPAGVADGGNIIFAGGAGETVTDFIFRDTRNMLITHDDEAYLNKYNGMKPDRTVTDEATGMTVGLREPKETIISKYFQSTNTNGNFSIFHRDGDDFVGLSYEPYNSDSNPDDEDPKYPTPFGVFGADILAGKSPNEYVIKFEVLVSQEQPMKGDALVVGFFNGVSGETWVDARKYCSCWQPSKAVYEIDPETNAWDNSKVACEAWSCPDWMTVAIPMEDLRYDFVSGNYRTNPQDDRRVTDGSAAEYNYYGDKETGLPFFTKNSNYKDLFDEESPADLGDASVSALAIILDKWDSPEQDLSGRHPYIAVDNVRIVPKNDNGGIWTLLNWGAPTRDFYTKPVLSCK